MKIFLDTIGCRLNQAEIESLARQFQQAGHQIVPTAAEADLAVVNTCTVTAEAASDSRAAIRRAQRSGAKSLAVTGCWVTLDPQKAATLPGVTRIFPNSQKDGLAAAMLDLPLEYFDLEPLARQPLPGLHQRTRAFIKVQDGCDNRCTFCITTLARGVSTSRPLERVLVDVQAAQAGGAQEIVLTGVQLGSWGRDLEPPRRLSDLLTSLLSHSPAPRLRLSSLEPWDLEAEFFQLWSDPHLCRHLHLPLQSGSAPVLRRMARKTSPDEYAALLAQARLLIPQVAITTDLIVGFPGETEQEFTETLEFVRDMQFAGGHVFTYSSRPGTPAARMQGQVRGDVARRRGNTLRELLADSAKAYRSRFIGKTLPVLWEARTTRSESDWQVEGLTDNYIPVNALAPEPRWNQIDQVLLEAESGGKLSGKIIPRCEPAHS